MKASPHRSCSLRLALGAVLLLAACESPTPPPSPPPTPPVTPPPVAVEAPNVVLAGLDNVQGRRGAYEDGTWRVECDFTLTMYANEYGPTQTLVQWSGGRLRWYDLSVGELTTTENLSASEAESFWGKATIGSGEMRGVQWMFWDEQPFRLEVEFYYGFPGKGQSTASHTLRCQTPPSYTARGSVSEWPHTLGKARGVLVSVGDKSVKTDAEGQFIIPDVPWNQRTLRFESGRHSSTPEKNSWGSPEGMSVYLARLAPKLVGFVANTVGGTPEQVWEGQEVTWFNPGGADKLPNEARVTLSGPDFSGTVTSTGSQVLDGNRRRYTFRIPGYVAAEATFSLTNTADYTGESVCSRTNLRETFNWRCKETET